MNRETADAADHRSSAPWAGEPHLGEAALADEYPDMLGPGKWDRAIAGGPPPGPREFWIAEEFGFRRRGSIAKFAMAMYARKGLGARPGHCTNVRGKAGHGDFGNNLVQKNAFRKFHIRERKDGKRTPYGFRTEIADGYYRVIWLEDDSSVVNGSTETHAPAAAYSSVAERNGEMTVDKAAKAALDELQGEALPLRVLSWRVTTGFDTVDDPAIWVWATLEPGAACARDAREKRNALQRRIVDKVSERIRKYDNNIWIYVYFTGPGSDTA